MRKVLHIKWSHEMELILEGSDMQRVSIYAATKEAKKEALHEILKKVDEGYELDVQFSLESLFLGVMEEYGAAKAGEARNKRQFPKWVRYDFSPPPEYSPEEIKENRKEIGISQTQLGQITVQSYPVVCRWENGTSKPNIHQMRIMQMLFADPYVLLDSGIITPRYSISERSDRLAKEEEDSFDVPEFSHGRGKRKTVDWDEE